MTTKRKNSIEYAFIVEEWGRRVLNADSERAAMKRKMIKQRKPLMEKMMS